ncbi:MAG: histidinol-phosphate transaminase [Campylobacterota bacterium]|nr:histidinol-phosphate transaminase [Campylobacterota bacterium]
MQFNSSLEGIKTYEAGKPIELVVREYGIEAKDIVKLASNENPYGCSLHVKQAVSDIISKMARYPDDSMYKLKDALASHFEVKSDNVIIGAGSDQVIEFAVHAKANKERPVLMNAITFAMYEIYARHVGAPIIRTTSQEHDLDQFYALYKAHNPSIIFICTPNNPTGDAIDADKLLAFLEKIDSDTLVVVDGAYMEYTRHKDSKKAVDVSALIAGFDNVLYLGTFSKAYGLGGMRVGYGIAHADMITAFYKLRPPFNITTLSLEAATVALADEEFVNESIIKNFDEMRRYEKFAKVRGLDYIESYTNFVTLCFKAPRNSSDIAQELLKQGMIVRDLTGYGLNAIRVTVGTADENERFFNLCAQQL